MGQTDSFLRLTLFANMLLDCLPAGCSHDALVLRTAALGVVVVLHAKVVSHLMRHRCGYQSHQPIIVLSTTKKKQPHFSVYLAVNKKERKRDCMAGEI